MYHFINDYPYFRENGLSNECQGVCHDKDNWYFTQDGNLWKIPLVQDLNQKFKGTDASKGVKKVKLGGHLGDLDYYEVSGVGYLFIADNDGEYETYISIVRASDLWLLGRYPVYRGNGRFKDIGWCAINRGCLYTSNGPVEGLAAPIYIFKIDTQNIVNKNMFRRPYAMLRLQDENGRDYKIDYMQGGCFDKQNHLHIANGYYENYQDALVWKPVRHLQGIHVFKVPTDYRQGEVRKLSRLCKSNQKSGFKYKFDTLGQEPEGLTWWDLDKDPRAPAKERGQLHVILLDNDSDTDDLVFKHFRRNP